MKHVILTLALAAISCAEYHDPFDGGGAAGSAPVRVAPGSPADWQSGYNVDERTPVDVGVKASALTLHSSFTCINSEGGAEIFRSNSGYDVIRCFVMAKGSTGPGCNPWHWDVDLIAGGAKAVNGSTRWEAHSCNSVGCSIRTCTGSTCTAKGSVNYTSTSSNIFVSNPGTDGFSQITCTTNGGGSYGHPILKRYTP